MLYSPKAFQDLLQCFQPAFTRPSFKRFSYLVMAAILTLGSHTVLNLLRTLESFQQEHWTSFHRFFSRRRWKPWCLARVLSTLILMLVPSDEPVRLAGDDTVDGHRGKNVYGKGCHRDAVRSTHTHLVYRWGQKWVVLSVLVKLPWSGRTWALPALVALYRTKEINEREGRRHKTPPELMRGLLAQMIHWFPERKFIFSGDQGFGTQELADFAYRHRTHLTLISRLPPDAILYAPLVPPRRPPVGRPRVHGRRLRSPESAVKDTPLQSRRKLAASWYGGGHREVRVVTGAGCWYRPGNHHRKTHPVPIRWVFVEDLTGTHRDEYFFSTDDSNSPTQIVDGYVGRWSIEVTFEEVRPYLGLETTRGWSENTVLRVAPSIFALYSIVVLLFCLMPGAPRAAITIHWPGKSHLTFSDVITHVRRWLWAEGIFQSPGFTGAIQKLTARQRKVLLYGVAPAA